MTSTQVEFSGLGTVLSKNENIINCVLTFPGSVTCQVDAKYSNLYTQLRGGKRKIYLGMITALDEQVGRLKSALVDRKMWDNTAFVFYSDVSDFRM